MKTGTVKFFNEAKSFGRMAAGGGKLNVLFNPKEYPLRKVIVRGWNPEKKEEFTLKKEEGGRHTPFQNKYRPQLYSRTTDGTGEMELPMGRGLAHLHESGIIHRDLAARNILVGQSQLPMISDFGLSRNARGLCTCQPGWSASIRRQGDGFWCGTTDHF